MSGMLGFFDAACSAGKGKATLRQMLQLLYHQPFYENDRLFAENGIYGSRVHKGITQPDPQPYVNKHVCVWLDGEIHNRTYFDSTFDAISDPEFIAQMYLKKQGFPFLKNIDGIFSAIIYDQKEYIIHFIGDRYGFNFLYYFQRGERLAWFSEAKAALALDYFEPKINRGAIHDFFTEGYLTDQKSWFQGVELFPAATVMSWDISQKKFLQPSSYWSWDDISIQHRAADEREIVKETGRLFKESVAKRSRPSDRVGLTLSGGLDSRAILAAMPASDQPVHTFTFGKPGCWDIKIAQEVSKIKGAQHHVLDLTAENWLCKRVAGVWWTDGQMNLKHMHVLALLPSFSRWFNLSLNGFLGAAILGGYYLNNKNTIQEKLRDRGRRFINEGSRLGRVFDVFYRRPFIDNRFVDYTLSVPPEIRENSHLYNQMVLREFPEYFRSIPWQRTGFAVSDSRVLSSIQRKVHALRNRGVKLLHMLNVPFKDYKHYHNYPVWIRREAEFVESILQNTGAIYPEFIDINQVYTDWEAHKKGRDRSGKICAYLTFEIFLQQVFEKKNRPKF